MPASFNSLPLRLVPYILAILAGCAFASPCALAKRVVTTHKTVKKSEKNAKKDKPSGNVKEAVRKVEAGESAIVDNSDVNGTVFYADSVSFSGYDKSVNSSIESFLVTNRNAADIRRVEVKITYLDLQGRMLHSRNAVAYCFVPAGETRKADIPSWDRQKTYYYYLGPEPKRVATPYKVRIETVAVYLDTGIKPSDD